MDNTADRMSPTSSELPQKESQPVLCASYIALSSTAATILTKSILHPLDTIKCRLQSSTSRNWRHVLRDYAGRWGPAYLYGGLPIKLVFYVPYQAIYMTSYSATRRALTPANANEESKWSFLTRTITAAAVAEVTSCVARVPMETVKMRIQAAVVKNTVAAIQQIRRHGITACARLALPQTLLHDVPYSAIQWIFYESLRPWTQTALQRTDSVEKLENTSTRTWRYADSFMRTFLTGGFSGLMASTVTVPLDTIRTRVVVAAAAEPNVTIRSVVQNTYRLGGVRIFFRGAGTRVLWVTANMAVYFPLYEGFKAMLLRMQLEKERSTHFLENERASEDV